MDLNTLAKEIIEKNQYMTLSSVDEEGNPWSSPVVYAYDKNYNFYFVSIPSSSHIKNLTLKEDASIAIFDSRQRIGEGVGLQMQGVVKLVPLKNYLKAATICFKRNYPYGTMKRTFEEALKRFIDKNLYKFYMFTPSKTWINNPDSDIDERIEVKL